MIKTMKKKKINIIFLIFLIGIYPILPEYFELGVIPIYYFIPLGGLLLLFCKRLELKIGKSFVSENAGFATLCMLPYLFHFQISSLINWFITTILVFYLIDCSIKSSKQVEKALDIILFTSIIINVFGVIERITEINIWSYFETASNIANDSSAYYRNGIIRIESSFGVALTYSIYLLFINIISLYKIQSEEFRGKRLHIKYRKLLYILAYILSIVCIIFTQCRLPLITLVFVQFCYTLRGSRSNKIKKSIGMILILLMLFLAFGDVLAEKLGDYFSLLGSVFAGFGGKTAEDLTTAYRFELIPALLPYIQEKPIFGYGASYINSGFSFRVLDYQHRSIDNNYLAQAMYYGLIGLIGNIWWIVSIIKKNFLKILKKVPLDGFEFSMMILCIVYAINLFSVYQMTESHLFYVLVGLYCRYEKIKKRKI